MLQPTSNLSSHIRPHLLATHELVRLVTDLNALKIDHFILKGIPLNKLLYGDRLGRESRDIDILIQPKDIEAAHHYLISQRYQELHASVSIIDVILKSDALMRYVNEVHYWHPNKNIAIDLKWHAQATNCLGMAWCKHDDYNELDINSCTIKILKPEQNFYYLCCHAAKHQWDRLQWLADLAEFMQKIPLKWDVVITLAQETQAIRPLLEARCLLQQTYAITLKDIQHSFWDRMAIKTRLFILQASWFAWLKKRFYPHTGYLYFPLNFLLLPKLSQKYHHLTHSFVARMASLKQACHLHEPKPYQMILLSFCPQWMRWK